MSSLAILISGDPERPQAVRLVAEEHALELMGSDGLVEKVAWWRLYRIGESSSTHHFRRVDRRQWELRVTAGADRALLTHIGRRPIHRLLHPLRRLESLKIVAGIVVLGGTLAQHAPPEWLAKTIPAWAQRRLVGPIVAQNAPIRCAHEGGEAAVRQILVRLDPELGRRVEIVAANWGGFLVTASPADKIFIYRSALTEVEADALPALLAHELAHLRHGDPMVAVIRNNGFIGTWAAIMEANGKRRLLMDFSGLEERRADLEAMETMRRAGFPIAPAARMFEQMRVSKAQGGYFGYDIRDFHFGIDSRAQRWAAAARSDLRAKSPMFTERELDGLYNFCWTGRLPPLPHEPRTPATPPTAPGTGALRSPPDGRSS